MEEQGKTGLPKDEQAAPKGTNWFRPNRSAPGWHPSSWQGWLIVVVVVATIVTVVVLIRTGLL